MNEEWRGIPGYDFCTVSNLGRVRGSTGKVLKPQRINSGYLIVHLCEYGTRHARTIHRLVAAAFVPRVDGKPHVNHLNHDRLDNRAVNLVWATQKDNMQHAKRHDRMRPARRAVIGTSLRTGKERYFRCQRDAERALAKTRKQSSAISHCLRGKKKSAYGHVWRRA